MTLLLENFRRLFPAEIPNDPATFKRWADCACVEWPNDLTISAATAMKNSRTFDGDALARFRTAYYDWFILRDEQKDAGISDSQLQSPHRLLWRKRALAAASRRNATS